ncbi:hypothetical protein GA0061070_102917 [Kosakonia oryziphila]|uniref:Uncharacterized protein n=1 Tax=Kosakonia oryziphila TaxID=1005667 RepID=A0A1C4EZV0_9ENTR|nr:hypothetical protein GA0061070_102917 [Kosakonia oryziphila]
MPPVLFWRIFAGGVAGLNKSFVIPGVYVTRKDSIRCIRKLRI